jgi:FlaA1/EpsC-like NDP-sugar epimerase
MFQFSIYGDRVAKLIRRRVVSANLLELAPEAIQGIVVSNRLIFIRMWQAAVIAISLAASFLVRFDFVFPHSEMRHLLFGLLIVLSVKMLVFYVVGIEHGWWRFSGLSDLVKLFIANVAGSVVFTAATISILGAQFPRSVYLIDFLLCFLATSGARFGVRLYHEMVMHEVASKTTRKGLLIYGAGVAGLNLVREIRSNPSLNYRIIGFLDDNPHKLNASLMGVGVLGSGRDVTRIVERYRRRSHSIDEIVIAMPSASGKQMSEALANCRASGVPCKTIPNLAELLAGKVRVSEIREISVENLLGREPVQLEHDRIHDSVAGRSILVTGAGGSIGSELCRQLLRFEPKCLVALDQAESDLFKIDMELSGVSSKVQICPVIGDIRDYDRMEEVIREYGVTSVYHAAAYKHVPMMEHNVIEAVTNNVIGLDNMVNAAYRNGVNSFVMISSDKAVNPTNVMGLTKRVTELIVQSMPDSTNDSGTKFVSVRFGNVLGSNGSVVPIFKQQIARGGPVTITHPEMRRYFMTIPEAVQLVLQASVMGKGSEIFVLDMGEPVKIIDLARNMIRLSGHEPEVDIPIQVTGLRPGEKLCEELSTESDETRPTYHEKIMVFCGSAIQRDFIDRWMSDLRTLISRRDEVRVLSHMADIVPEYQPSGKWQTALNRRSLKAAAGD